MWSELESDADEVAGAGFMTWLASKFRANMLGRFIIPWAEMRAGKTVLNPRSGALERRTQAAVVEQQTKKKGGKGRLQPLRS